MTEGMIGGLIGIGFLTIVNVCVVSYTYGRLTQKVMDICRRLDILEKRGR